MRGVHFSLAPQRENAKIAPREKNKGNYTTGSKERGGGVQLSHGHCVPLKSLLYGRLKITEMGTTPRKLTRDN